MFAEGTQQVVVVEHTDSVVGLDILLMLAVARVDCSLDMHLHHPEAEQVLSDQDSLIAGQGNLVVAGQGSLVVAGQDNLVVVDQSNLVVVDQGSLVVVMDSLPIAAVVNKLEVLDSAVQRYPNQDMVVELS